MNIVNWFDPNDLEHLKAYKYLVDFGTFPKRFIPEDMETSSCWQLLLMSKIADHFIAEKIEESKAVPKQKTKINFEKDQNGKWKFNPLDYEFEDQYYDGNGYCSAFYSEILKIQYHFLCLKKTWGYPEEKNHSHFFLKNLVMFFLGKNYELKGELKSGEEVDPNFDIEYCISTLSGIQQLGSQGCHRKTDEQDYECGFKEIKRMVKSMVRSSSNGDLEIVEKNP